MNTPKRPLSAGKLRDLDAIHSALRAHTERHAAASDRPYEAPVTETEIFVASVWMEIIGCARAGRQDDFFQLGGNSIKAVQVLSLLRRKRMNLDIPLREVFEYRQLRQFAERVDTLSGSQNDHPALHPVPRGQPLVVTSGQERLWFIHQMGDDSAYNVPIAIHLRGAVHINLLQEALQLLSQRHESLRTSFVTQDAIPMQVVHDRIPLPLEFLDASASGMDLSNLLHQQASKRFDLQAAPLMRALLVKVSPHEHVLCLTMHHIISDAWSIGIVATELVQYYRALLLKQDVALPQLAVQYADIAAWMSQMQQTAGYAQERDYWRQKLSNLPGFLELPADYPRPRALAPQGAQLESLLSESLTRKLHTLANATQSTLFMVVLAAFKVLLHHHSGQGDLCVGTPVAGRTRTEMEGVIGFFTNTLTVRTQMHAGMGFLEYLAQVKATTVEALSHQSVSFEQIVKDIAPERSLAHTPVFQVMFILQNTPAHQLSVPDLSIDILPTHAGGAKFDLTCSLQLRNQQLQVNLEYSTALFKPSTIERLATHYQTILEAVCDAPEQPIGSIPLLGAHEKQRVLYDWNQTQTLIDDARIQARIAHQAAQNPTHTAVIFKGAQLNYQALEQRVEALHQRLSQAQVGPGCLVGIYLERSPDMVAAMLAIWRAGAAYVPLDPNYPQDRIAWMLSDARPAVVISHTHLHARLPSECTVLCIDALDQFSPMPTPGPLRNPEITDETAYVMYTSGSTGKPKGVMVTHIALRNFMQGMQVHLNLCPSSTWLAVTSLSFDIAGLELLLPLIHGARVVLASAEDLVDGARLNTLMAEHQVSHMQATPATWALLEHNGMLHHRLESAICGGEAWGIPLADYLAANAEQVINAYGPTETTIWSTVHTYQSGKPLTIGRPIANTEIYILDKSLQPVPIGVAGDLYIGGQGLAQGYLHQPALTAERFITHPFKGISHKLYTTGDQAKFLEDGQVVYLGRADGQIKLRGFRIELGEIESVLQEHAQVKRCAVIVVDLTHSKYLAAFVVLKASADDLEVVNSIEAELRTLARAKLPEYMVPARFHCLPELPSTPNGKTDRKALLALAQQQLTAAPSSPVEEAQTDTERTICTIVAELVERSHVAASDNFFDVGGHSLLGMRLLARVNEQFGAHVSVRELFDSPTPQQLAALVEQQLLLHKLTAPRSTDEAMEVQEF
jgi:amino acid adenylation domain-containing protein